MKQEEASRSNSNEQLGRKIREARLRQGLTLKEVGQAVDLSEGFLSQLERGKVNASIATLQRIADMLGIKVIDIFENSASQMTAQVIRRHDRPMLLLGNHGRKYVLSRSGAEQLEIFFTVLEPGGSTGDSPYSHGDSEEFVHVNAGLLQVDVGSVSHLLSAGDSIHFHSSIPHSATNVGTSLCEALWVSSPPSY